MILSQQVVQQITYIQIIDFCMVFVANQNFAFSKFYRWCRRKSTLYISPI